jgi:2-oxoglutarate dehydrogenase E2 component (dihydrolipoamide succinyltransferase)
MAVELRVPSLGESVAQAQVGQWLKQEGDAVALDEPLVEVESEKATVAVPAPAAGVLARIRRRQGETVAVGEVLAEIEPGAARAAPPPAAAAPRAAAPPAPGGAIPAGAPAAAPPATAVTAAAARPAGPTVPPPAAAPAGPGAAGAALAPARAERAGEPRLTPSARRLLAERGLGKADLLRLLEAAGGARPLAAPSPEALAPPGPRERLVPMSPLRRTVARRLLEAQENAAILTTFNEVDMSRVIEMRERHGPAFLERHGVKLGFMSFFVKAAVEALMAFPAVNAEVRGDAVLYKDHYDIGVAVGGGKGLVVPVVRDADQLTFAQVELSIAELSSKAKENRIALEDLAGGTFTISNGGIYGSLLSTPILNPPQSGILGLHKIEKRVVVGPGDVPAVRPMMFLALSYDHRIIDGREAVSFLVKLKELVEEPGRLLLEV